MNCVESLIWRNSGTYQCNPHTTLNEDDAQQLRDNPTGMIEAFKEVGLPWERIFDQIRDWAETVSIEI